MQAQEASASSVLLATKLFIPPVHPEIVSRPHLLNVLDSGLGGKLILVSAPAGFGKTTLLSKWIRSRALPAAWISLDENDNETTGFLKYLTAAFQQMNSDIGRSLEKALRSPQLPPINILLAELINDIAEIQEDFVLVLDDYHSIMAQPVHDITSFLLDYLPPQVHLVIASRSDPPLPLARLRGRGQLTELRAVDLRFNVEEVGEFLVNYLGQTLPAVDIEALALHTEGWIAGLQMAAVSMRGRGDIAGFVQSFTGSNRYIFDYLVEEVLQRQPEHIVSFLLTTSILDRLTGPLCDMVAERSDSQAILTAIEQANLFIVSLDDQRRWYRYHHLFADLLYQHLQETNPAIIPELHRRASTWYEQNDMIPRAIDHALKAGDNPRVAQLLNNSADMLWDRGEQTRLWQWLQAIPEELLRTLPRLCSYQAMMLCFSGHQQEAEARLELATQALEAGPDDGASRRSELHGIIAAVHAYNHYLCNRVPELIEQAEKALAILPERESMWRSAVASVLGDAHSLNGDLFAAERAYSSAAAIGSAAENMYFVLLASLKLAVNKLHLGKLSEAKEVCQQQLLLVDQSGFSQTARAGGLYAVWGSILYEQNDIESAETYLQRGIALCEEEQNIVLMLTGYHCLLRFLMGTGNLTKATEVIRQVESLAEQKDFPAWFRNAFIIWQTRLWIANHTRHEQLATRLKAFAELTFPTDSSLELIDEPRYVAMGRLLLACGSIHPDATYLPDALHLFDYLYARASAMNHINRALEMLILKAVTLQALGEDGQAVDALETALRIAEPEGYVRIFLDEGPPLLELLHKTIDRKVMLDYADRLLDAAKQVRPSPRAEAPQNLQVDPLSDRELEVLKHIAEGDSNAAIAQELCIALGTVKNHTKSIYSKLNVHSRTQAIACAREMEIII
jgi:LuxR family maltose regulon positive regulatory protein